MRVVTQKSAQGSTSFFATTEQNTSDDIENNVQIDQEDTININTATKEQLMQLPNIGEKKAEEIIQYRTVTPFDDRTELQEVKGIGVKTYEQLADLITV